MQEKLAQNSFLLLLALVTVLFGWLLQPFFGAVLWAVVIAIVFYPLKQHWEQRFGTHKNLLSLSVLGVCTLIVILPLLFVGVTLVQEVSAFYQKVDKGQINFSHYLEQVQAYPPLQNLMSRFGVDLDSIKKGATDVALQAGRYAGSQAVSIGQNTAQFVISFVLMLYLAFFFLRDGEKLVELLVRGLPLGDRRERRLLGKIGQMTNATVKGNLVVAAIQGALGGIIFWILGVQSALLWGVVMAMASLLPSVGSALIWAPVAIYFLVTGDIWQGTVLIAFGAGVIGMVDNVLRPILVGRETKMPDYLVLISTLSGIAIFGLNGFVLGPLIAALFLAFWDIFIREFNP